ncbi:MAG: patatin-like phospholipase family protein [Caulobacterales bacterium]|jgi:hypothetical protein
MSRTLKHHLDPLKGPKRILALDGGGVKGILTLGMLSGIEAELRRRSGDEFLVLSDYYDLIGGTSTGAIIASGLALGLQTAELISMYMKLGPAVFGRSAGDGLWRAKFDAKKLRQALEGVLGRRTLGTPDLRTGFALCAKRIDTGSAWVLSNNPNAKYYDPPDADGATVPNKKYRLIDIVQASAAAPTFFDEVQIRIQVAEGDDDRKPQDGELGYFVDGAVGANNNPSQQLLLLATVHEYGFGWKAGVGSLMMTSLGTGLRRPRISGKEFHAMASGLRGIQALRSMIYDTQLQGIMLMQALSDPLRPWIVNSEVEGMTKSLLTDTRVLDYQRMDVRLEPTRRDQEGLMMFAEDLLGRSLTAKQLADLDELANGKPSNMELLLELGQAGAARYVGRDYPNPYFDLPEWTKT